MAITSELKALDHSIYSAINRMGGQNKGADRNIVQKEFIKSTDFEKISKNFLDDRITLEVLIFTGIYFHKSNKIVFRGY